MFEGKVVVVTGGASGIGRQTALRFAQKGANLVIVTKNSEEAAKATVAEIDALGSRAIYVMCDVAREADVERMVKAAVDTFGSLDIAFNNAGVGPDGVTIPIVPLTEVTEHNWDWIADTNLKGVFLCLKHELRQMRAQRSGCIVTTASTAGLKPMANFGAYGPAKAGMIMLTKMAALENRDLGIRANVICPGPTRGTGMADRMFGNKQTLEGDPAGLRTGTTDEVASVVLWLCSEEAGYINGNVITIDGGRDIL